MIEAMIQIANACLFSIVPIAQCGIEGHDRFLDRRPFLLAASIFGYTRLPASLVRIRTRIPDILIPVCLGKEHAQTDSACQVGICRVEALDPADDGSQIDDVLKRSARLLRIDTRSLHDTEE